MATKKRTITGLIPGHATHTRTAETYMGALLPPPGVKVLLGVSVMRVLRGAREH